MIAEEILRNPEKLEEVERTAFRLVEQAIRDYLLQAVVIFREEQDKVDDIAEDVTREAMDSLGMATNERSSARPAQRILPPNPPNPSCCRSRGGMRGWPVHRPTHAPATSPQNKRQQRPPTKPKNPRAVTLWRHACLTTPVVKRPPLQPPSVQTQQRPNPQNQGNYIHNATDS